jgi:hypothetical protein
MQVLRLKVLSCLLLFLLVPVISFGADTTVGCPGGTPGAFTTISAALASLPLVGPNSIFVSGNCTETIVISSRTALSINATPGTATVTPANPNGRTLLILDSNTISIDGVNFTGGRGIFINDSNDVQLGDMTVSGSSFQGINTNNSVVDIFNATIQNNVRSGIASEGGNLSLDGGVTVTNNGRIGVAMFTGHLSLNGGDGTPGTENVISHNGTTGVELANSAEADISGDNRIISNSGTFGLVVLHTSTAMMSDGIINSNTGIGVHCGESSHCEFSGATNINSNGGGGVEITDHSDAYLDGGIIISGNTGVGVLVDLSSVLNSLGGNTINNNTGDGVVLNTLSVIKFAANDTITATPGNLALNCNNGSLVTGDVTPYKPRRCGPAFQTVPIH